MLNKVEYIDKKRFYTLGSAKFPSVTTILDLGFQKEWMEPYTAKRMATVLAKNPSLSEEELLLAFKESNKEARLFGDDVHERLERLFDGKSADFEPLDDWNLEYNPKFLFSESVVYSLDPEYAGRLDIVAKIGKFTYLIDLKTGNRLGTEIKLQLSAYKNAEIIVDKTNRPQKLPTIDKCAILWIPRDDPESWVFKEVSIGKRDYQAFLSCVDIANYHIANSGFDILGSNVGYG